MTTLEGFTRRLQGVFLTGGDAFVDFKKHRTAPEHVTRIFILSLLLAILSLVSGCATSLETYRPHSPKEAGVRDVLIKAKAAWNRQDAAAFAALLDKHSTFTLKKGGKVVDKETFVRHLPQKMKTIHWDFGTPTINIQGRKAFVDLALKTDPEKPVVSFTLRKKDGRWRILAIR